MKCKVTVLSGFHVDMYACRWIPDELGVPSFAQLHDLKTVPVTNFNAAFDIWHINAALSEGCGGPDLPEEIML